MLNITIKGTYVDEKSFSWDYYGDDVDAATFYILPQPQFVLQANGSPSFEVLRYATDDASNGSGFLRLDVELAVPADVQAAIAAQVPTFFPNAKTPYQFVAPNYNPGAKAYFRFGSGADMQIFAASASSYGANVATFQLPMTKTQLDTAVSVFGGQGGAYDVEYVLSVPARLPAVTATLGFNSAIAYQYQVTQPSYDSWGDETSPGSVSTLLNESAASTITIDWGTTTPSADLRQAVADWANDTLSDLVTTEVQKTIALQGLKSDNSFNISEVSSFTSIYSENMVVDWLLKPIATLPTFPAMGIPIAGFESSVNERQQVMTVAVDMPFKGQGGNNSLASDEPATLPESVSVTVAYPGLPEAEATQVFTSSTTHNFVAPYDETAGPNWTVTYTVTYADSASPTVSPKAPIAVSTGTYTLPVSAAGILFVSFDGHQVFASEGTVPTEIDIAFSYIGNDGGDLIQQSATIKATDATKSAEIQSYYPLPITSLYNFQITYTFAGGVQWTAPLVTAQSGFKQVIPAADAVHSTNLIVFVSAAVSENNPLLDGPTVQLYYAAPPSTAPGNVTTLPSKSSPAVFTVTPATDAKSNTIGHEAFVGVLSGNQPIVYSASLDMGNGQIDINDAMVENDQASIMITPTQRYFTLQIDPSAIEWTAVSYSSVEVLVSATIKPSGTGSTSQPPERSFIWNKNEGGSFYVTYSIQDGDTVSYAWKANYVTPNAPVQTATGKGSDIILNVPANPS